MGRPAKPKIISMDSERQAYVIMRPNGFNPGITWQYAYDKACKLHAAFRDLGITLTPPDYDNVGTLAGYEDYVRLTEEAKAYHGLFGHVFTCMLHEQFIGLEGCRVWADGNTFYVSRLGHSVPIHIKHKIKEAKRGNRISKVHYDNITVLERS